MKRFTHLFIACAVLAPATLRAAESVDEAVAALGILPKDREGKHIQASEVNPFKTKVKETPKFSVQEDTETQESKIRAIIKAMPVNGYRRSKDGQLMALASELILRVGQELPPLLQDQTEKLTVSKITPKYVELTFLENKDSTQPRTILNEIKNGVRVRQKLPGVTAAAPPENDKDFYLLGKAEEAGLAAGLEATQPGLGGSSGDSMPEFRLPPAPAAQASSTRIDKPMSGGLVPSAEAPLVAPPPQEGATLPAPPAPERAIPLDQPKSVPNAPAPADSKPTLNQRRPGPPIIPPPTKDTPAVQ